MNIDMFDLYLFDLDGTLVNTEELHCSAYNSAFKYYHVPIELSFEEYCEYAHLDDSCMRNMVQNINNTFVSYEQIYQKKKDIFLELLDTHVDYIKGAEKILNSLISRNINTCIVT